MKESDLRELISECSTTNIDFLLRNELRANYFLRNYLLSRWVKIGAHYGTHRLDRG
jgi:hypothetical protein